MGGKSKKKGGYTISGPMGTGWKRMGEGESVSFIKINDATDDDVVTIFLAFEDTGRKFGSAEELAAFLREKGGASMQEIEVHTYAGVAGAKFFAAQEDNGSGGTLEEREALGLPAREAGAQYFVRTKGFVFIDPKKPTRIIKIGISRTSITGIIGDYYGGIADSFIDTFIRENEITGLPSSGGGYVGDGSENDGGQAVEVPPEDSPPMLNLD